MKTILENTIKKYGDEAQLIIAVEELSELTKEITKYIRGKRKPIDMAEEIADVLIMIEQVKIICDIHEKDIDFWKDIKLKRLQDLHN